MQNAPSIEEVKHDDDADAAAAAHGHEEMQPKKSKSLTVDSLTPFEQFIIMKEFCEVTSKKDSCDDDDYLDDYANINQNELDRVKFLE